MAFATDTTFIIGNSNGFVFGTADGVAWDGPTLTVDTEDAGLACDNTSTVIAAVGEVFRSVDNATTFAQDTTGIDPDAVFFSAAYDQSIFFLGGSNFVTSAGVLITSPGDGTWTPRTTPFTGGAVGASINGTYFNNFNSTLMIGGTLGDRSGGISLSTDHINWSTSKPNSFTSDGTFNASVNDFASNGASVIIAVGHIGQAGGNVAHAQRSLDGGETWSDMTLDSFGAGGDITAATYANGRFLICGFDSSGVAHLEGSDDDGVTWVAIDVSDILVTSDNIYDVKWSGDLGSFVLASHDTSAGSDPVTAVSPTGLAGTWVVPVIAYPGLNKFAVFAIATRLVIPPPRLPICRILYGRG